MRKVVLYALGVLLVVSVGFVVNDKLQNSNNKMAELRKQHENFLKNSPFNETIKLSKKERKANGLPPNKYLERQWELIMNPAIGKPEPQKLFELQEQLRQKALYAKVPGENLNNWIERGPNNVGGRTRAIMFDPNDTTNKRVFAGGVSGGLWVNNDITQSKTAWTEVNIPQNLAISCITYDPNNTMTFYIGTGESYVQGDATGNGVWKSTDGGTSWAKIFGGITGETTFETSAKLTVNSPGAIAGDYQVTTAGFGPALTSLTGNLILANDGTSPNADACTALINGGAINGNIAVVERGSCDFTVKVKNAQNAGAVAVLVVNNVGGPPISLGGTDASITIPSVMISKTHGQAIMAQLGAGVNVTIAATSVSIANGRFSTPGIQHINDIKIRNLGSGNSEIYVAVGAAFYTSSTPWSISGVKEYGLYKSSNSGTSWSKVSLPATSGSDYIPNDIEVSANNTVWLSTTNIVGTTSAGSGTILSSSDGVTFTVKKIITDGERTQIAVSSTNANKIYALAELASGTNGAAIIRTNDGFVTDTNLTLPIDAASSIPATDFTNGQAFYDLLIEVDPNNDAIVYVGGIDLFRSANSGDAWSQIAEYYSSTGKSIVHPDHHAFVFHPTNSNIALNGNDGGVYYATSLSTTPVIDSRNRNYNTVQFYHGNIGQETANTKLVAGAQDNGTQFINNGTSGINSSTSIRGGDGAYSFIDRNNQYIIASYVYNSYQYKNYSTGATIYTIDSDQDSGQFINPAALDSQSIFSNYLFTDGTKEGVFQINRYQLPSTSSTSTITPTILTNALLTGAPTAFKVSTLETNTIFIGTENGRLLKLTNSTGIGTATWTNITGTDFYGSISCIELGATVNDIYVTFYNYGVTSVFYSANGGASWVNKEGNLPDLPVRAIMRNPLNSNEVILGTDLGVWASPNFNDANPNWYQSQNGMKDVVVTSFDIRTADNTVLATTYGRGMFTGQFTAAPSALSIHKKSINELIEVYPTVSNGNFKIKAQNSVKDGYLKIFNMNGREVYASKIDFNRNSSKDISLKAASGIYIVKFASENKQSTHKIVIK